MNFVSGMPSLFGFAMYTGGPQAGFANWTMVGGLSLMVSLSMVRLSSDTRLMLTWALTMAPG